MAEDIKKYVLMHKNIPVADLELDEAACTISAVGHVYSECHVPVGITVKKGSIDRSSLNSWWRGRAIPASRAGIENALAQMNLSTTQKLLEKCLGLSLSDQYWICPSGSGIEWSRINFFEHTFSNDVGNILFGQGFSGDHMSLMSPDNTSDGWLKKKWKIIDGKRCLVKGGSGATCQEPYNEVLASSIMEHLNIPHVKYSLLIEDDYPYSVCEDFITSETELISAWYLMQTAKKPNHVSVYQHYLDCCERYGIPGIRESLDYMMVLDYLIVNEDRHQNNFGVVRNAETLEYMGAAPIFDSGTSLWFDKPNAMIGMTAKAGCKPFKNDHEEQIKLVSSFDWLDLHALDGIDEELRELVRGSLFIDENRCDALCRALRSRIDRLTDIVNTHRTGFAAVNCQGDVTEDVAYSGKYLTLETTEHSTVIVNFVNMVYNQLKDSTCRVFSDNVQYKWKDGDEEKTVIPDASINCQVKSRKGNCFINAPQFILEVLSPSTEKYDRGEKKKLYCEQEINEYWIVNWQKRVIEIYDLDYENDKPEYYLIATITDENKENLKLTHFPNIKIYFDKLFDV